MPFGNLFARQANRSAGHLVPHSELRRRSVTASTRPRSTAQHEPVSCRQICLLRAMIPASSRIPGNAECRRVRQRNPGPDRKATRKRPDRERPEIDYRSLAERAPAIFYRYRLSSQTLAMEYINPAVTDTLGYSPDDFYADPDLCSGRCLTTPRLRRVPIGARVEHGGVARHPTLAAARRDVRGRRRANDRDPRSRRVEPPPSRVSPATCRSNWPSAANSGTAAPGSMRVISHVPVILWATDLDGRLTAPRGHRPAFSRPELRGRPRPDAGGSASRTQLRYRRQFILGAARPAPIGRGPARPIRHS